MKRQKLLLVGLLGVLVLAAVYSWRQMPRQEQNGAAVATGRSRLRAAANRSPATAQEDPLHLQLELLKTAAPPPFKGAGKDIFGPLYVVKAPPAPKLTPRVAPPPPVPVAVPAAPVRIQPHFTFLGFLQKEKGGKAIFLAEGKDLFIARQGERFGKKREYLLTELTAQRAVVRKADDPRPIVISLQQSRAPGAPSQPAPQLRSLPRQLPLPGAPSGPAGYHSPAQEVSQ